MKKSNLSMIAAMAPNRGIGYENTLPWKCSEDMKFFKEYTTGKSIIMGWKTFESLGCKPLPNRKNWVITNKDKIDYNSTIDLDFSKFTEMLRRIDYWQSEQFVVIGGAQIYELFAPYISEAIITQINNSIIDENQQFDTYLMELPDHLDNVEIIKEYDNCNIKRHF